MLAIVLHVILAVGYTLVGLRAWQPFFAHGAQRPLSLLVTSYRLLLLLHAGAVALLIFTPAGLQLGLAMLSLTAWLSGVVLSIDMRLDQRLALVVHAPFAALACAITAAIPQQLVPVVAVPNAAFALHLLVAALSYALFAVVALEALLVAVAERALHRRRLAPWLEALPPVVVFEAHLFRLIAAAFVLLTLTNLSGLFSEALFGIAWRLDHKVLLALLAWLIFALLLFGRWRFGWRGAVALRWFWAGLALLALAYLGFHFVRDLILAKSLTR